MSSSTSQPSFSPTGVGWLQRIADGLVRRAGWVLMVSIGLTTALALPMVLLRPTTMASQQPSGAVILAEQRVNERFASHLQRAAFVIEATSDNLLTQAALVELQRAARSIREDPELRAELATYREPRSGRDVFGVATIADVVDVVLGARYGIELTAATDEQVQQALSLLFQRVSPSDLGLRVTPESSSGGGWVAKAALVRVFGDKQAITRASPPSRAPEEHFARRVLARLRGRQTAYRAWGIAIDPTLTSAEQGKAAGPYIGLTIMAVLVLVGLAYRSYWPVALCGAALGSLMIWMRGLCNLVGLKSDQILDTLVPIAMISFGIDFAFHAIGRYREQGRQGLAPARALHTAFSGVLGALLLAAVSDAAAFLSNTAAPIEALVQLGIAAAFSQLAALLLLGIVVPLGLMRIEQLAPPRAPSRRRWALALSAASLAALGAMGTVVVLVFVSETLGLVLLAAYALCFIGAPLVGIRLLRRRHEPAAPIVPSSVAGEAMMGRLVAWLARHRRFVLPVTAAGTLVCIYLAVQVKPRFDVKDFFAPKSDFVVGLDKLDEYWGEHTGELATVYIEADLAQPAALGALRRAVAEIQGLATERLARNDDGAVAVQAPLLELLRAALVAREALRSAGLTLEDHDGDGLPDRAIGLAALYDYLLAHGLAGQPAYTPEMVESMLWQSADRTHQATRVDVRLPGSRSQENIRRAAADLAPVLARLQSELGRSDPTARVVLTGTPVSRQASLDAILQAFHRSLPVALGLCFLLAAAFMRSWRYAALSLVPILLVVAWLYAFMHVAGFGINVVTATIGAVSIGIGIDYAIHFTMRYREELTHSGDRQQALAQAGRGTGSALAVSAASSVAGFGILACAPMPMFADYGLLTAMMIGMAACATLLVLPSLLTLMGPVGAQRRL